ncbi:hypothetical protein BDD43_5120 [Mucilaginibacter gracilis]|uniref:Uncharacterized protein n=1 Tax=Mucilaginibacter gracilis TaxID=423350 RepID=A0A495J7K4_9SPHI|nr:hypothetical protein [Mucilaginibacter gracilis]RKR84867.1 hypothetical protein BDD43_5120 [Mucilaginibacter gracilis]
MGEIMSLEGQIAAEKEKERKVQLEKIERAKEREAEHIEKQKEKQSDRWFQTLLLITGAILGVLATKLADYFFK